MDLSQNLAPILTLPENTTGKDYIIGDLHGLHDQLIAALEKLNFDKTKDRVFSVGDLVDRGPKNIECLELLTEEWFFAVRGNHEQMMFDAARGRGGNPFDYNDPAALWIYNGGNWAYNEQPETITFWRKIIDRLPYIIVVGEGENRYNIVHAEFITCSDIDIDNGTIIDQSINQWKDNPLLWGRQMAVYGRDELQYTTTKEMQASLSITYVGHTPLTELLRIHQQVYLDGGAVFGLTRPNETTYGLLHIACHHDKVIHTFNIRNDLHHSTTNIDDIKNIQPTVNKGLTGNTIIIKTT